MIIGEDISKCTLILVQSNFFGGEMKWQLKSDFVEWALRKLLFIVS